jgi:Peptidase family M1 domain
VKYFLLVFVCICQLSIANAQTFWQQQVNYNITVQLNDKDHTLDAFEKIEYTNNSNDTLRFIWFHVWMNAYKNDKTAFSEQLLQNDDTRFYFSPDSAKGYTNNLNFKVNGSNAKIEEHPKHIDIIKLLLPQPLAPHQSITITTPFHVKLPYNFSRGGHVGQTYQVAQWYPKPAVYDAKGWHEMPYLDQGEFYSEFGNFDVQITLPENYLVAASGQLQTKEAIAKLKAITSLDAKLQPNFLYYEVKRKGSKTATQKIGAKKITASKQGEIAPPPSSSTMQTLQYTLANAHDFAWFASKLFIVNSSTQKLANKAVDVFTYYHPWDYLNWANSISYAKDGLAAYSNYLGDYPYSTASVVCGNTGVNSGGMEYPTITLITTKGGGKGLDEVIAHELGHNWFYGALASNERDHAWMDEGMNTFYQNKYIKNKYSNDILTEVKKTFIGNKIPDDEEALIISSVEKIHKDQPIDLPATQYTKINYGLMVYSKASLWMKQLELQLGKENFAKAMQQYYKDWQFKHPLPIDFKNSIEQTTGQNIDSLYNQLFTTALPNNAKKKTQLVSLFSMKETDKYNHIAIAPLLGYNNYDKIMIGAVLHNYQLPLNKFNFFAAPMYATGSKTVNFFGRASYNVWQKKSWLEISTSVAKFTADDFSTAKGDKLSLGVTKIVPSIKYTLYNKDERSKQRYTFQVRSFLINEQELNFYTIGGTDFVDKATRDRTVNQLKISSTNNRLLYPYDFNVTIDQGRDFVRTGFTGNYFFNYGKSKGGMQARLFAGKFFYTTSKTFVIQYQTDRYHLNMSGARGYEDYTYSDYFVGRSEFEGWQSQQIMQRDGFFKVRTDLLGSKVGKTDNWLMALNLSGNIPDKLNPLQVLPFKIPLHFFIDIGTYAEAWKDNPATGRFLYDAGLQLPLFKSLVNVYFPLIYSKVYGDYFKSTLGEKRFWKTVSFSVNLDKLKLNKISRDIPL